MTWQRSTEPDITVGTGDTVTSASTLKILAAPTEGTNNYALWVDSGVTRLDGRLGVGGDALGYAMAHIGGSLTSDGSATSVQGLRVDADITGANGDTSFASVISTDGASITTQGNSETIARIASLHLTEPDITVGSGDTVTSAATLYVADAPTEGSNNYALWVDSGATQLDGTLDVEGVTTLASLDVTGNTTIGGNLEVTGDLDVGYTVTSSTVQDVGAFSTSGGDYEATGVTLSGVAVGDFVQVISASVESGTGFSADDAVFKVVVTGADTVSVYCKSSDTWSSVVLDLTFLVVSFT